MTLVGYPDFQEQAQWQSPPAVIASTAINNGTTLSFPQAGPVYFNVSNWNATQLRLSGAQVLDVECIWYDAIPATAYLARSYYSTAANIGSVVSLPNGGPYLQVNVTNSSGVNDTLTSVIAFTNRRQQPFIVPTSGPIIYTSPTTVGAGAQATVTSSYLYAGLAYLWVATTATAWRVDVNNLTSNGTATFVAQLTSTETGGGPIRRVPLILPPRPVQLGFHNDGAGAADFYASLVPDVFR